MAEEWMKEEIQQIESNNTHYTSIHWGFQPFQTPDKKHFLKSMKLLSHKNIILNEVHLCRLSMDGERWKGLFHMLKSSKSVSVLRVVKMEMDWNGLCEVMKGNGCLLSKVHLIGTAAGEKEAGMIAKVITSNSTLTDLSLEGNQLGTEGISSIAKALKGNHSLLALNLEKNKLTDKALHILTDALLTNKTLLSLSLKENPITDVGGMDIVRLLDGNVELREVELLYTEVSAGVRSVVEERCQYRKRDLNANYKSYQSLRANLADEVRKSAEKDEEIQQLQKKLQEVNQNNTQQLKFIQDQNMTLGELRSNNSRLKDQLEKENIQMDILRKSWDITRCQMETMINVAKKSLQMEATLQAEHQQSLAEDRVQEEILKLALVGKKREMEAVMGQLQSMEYQTVSQEHFYEVKRKLEKEKVEIIRDRETIEERLEEMKIKIEAEETRMKQDNEMQEQAEKVVKSLQDSLYSLSNREKEYEIKLKAAQQAKQAMEKERHEAKEKAELLAKQLEILKQRGVTQQEHTFQQTLTDIQNLLKKHQQPGPRVFISYSTGKEGKKMTQEWVGRLAKDLRKVGAKVSFVLDDLQGNVRDTVSLNIAQSNSYIVLCTPQWKARIDSGLTDSIKDCMENNEVDELEAGLSSLCSSQPDNKFSPNNITSWEYVNMWMRVKQRANNNHFVPVLFSGTSATATLPSLQEETLWKALQHTDEEYYNLLMGLSNSTGMLGNILGWKGEEQERYWKEYEAMVGKFRGEMESIRKKMNQEALQTRISVTV